MKKRILATAMIIGLVFSIGACGNSSKPAPTETQTETEKQYSEFTWPEHGIGKDVPKPDKDPLIGSLEWEEENGFCLYVANMSKDEYDAYVNSCFDAGFSIDYSKGDDYFYAYDGKGYDLFVKYKEDNVMFVRVDAPEESETSSQEDTQSSTESESKAEAASNEIRPETKEALDSYESFMNDYVDFMKKYDENPSDSELLKEYADYMTKYADLTDKFNKMKDDLNNAELSYYLEVQSRVLKALSEVQ